MLDKLVALAGDLAFERKKLSEGLRKLEGTLLHGEVAHEVYETLGIRGTEELHVELDSLARSLDRIGALTKTLVHHVNRDRLEPCDGLLAEAAENIEAAARHLGRPVEIECRANDVQLDRETIAQFRPVFLEMLAIFVEYAVESAKEREAREKRPRARIQLETKPLEDGYRIMVVCDGNGIMPPLASRHGRRLAALGARAAFEGKPGQWSAWLFHLPASFVAFRGVTVRAGSRRLTIPAWALIRTYRASETKPRPRTKIWGVDENLDRRALAEPGDTRTDGVYVEIAAGTETTTYHFDEVSALEEVYMKGLAEPYSGGGRFMGVVLCDAAELRGDFSAELRGDFSNETDGGELCLVVNPGYLVYGGGCLS